MRHSFLYMGGLRSAKRFSLSAVLCVAVMIGILSCGGINAKDISQTAFDLRLSGKVDEAKTLLDNHLADNPDDAAAYYELARLHLYTVTGGPGGKMGLQESISKSLEAIETAQRIDPDNVIYCFFAARVIFMNSYMAMQSGDEDIKGQVKKICDAFDAVLELKPDYGEALLHLVEIYGGLPEDMGADKAKAEQYAKKLEEHDAILGAKARAILMPEDADLIDFWKKIVEKHQGNAAALEALGKVYLREGKTEEGIKYMEQAFEADPSQTLLLLDMARYYMMSARRDVSLKETMLSLTEKAINRYLATDPIAPIEAYSIGLLAKIKYWTDSKEDGKKLEAEAEKIDMYFSRASAIPGSALFVAPGEESHHHTYMFQPF